MSRSKQVVLLVLALACIFMSCLCLVSWISQCHIETRVPEYTPAWVRMDMPIMSLYLSVPGVFTWFVASIIFFAFALE